MDSSLSLQYFLIILFSLIYWGFCFIILYHLVRFGVGTQPKKLAAFFLVGSVVLFCITIILWINIDIDSIVEASQKFKNDVMLMK